ncbi:MAG: DUF2922 family protein [Lactobacillus sp.]|jgi:hypothetical protein|nr:DUF2922 family protein [Lactobacillus sp.]MCI2033532.1 DUF2922 family protein [Lactobacillus sp.]
MNNDITTRTLRLSFLGADGSHNNFIINNLRSDPNVDVVNQALDDLTNLTMFQRGEVQLYVQADQANLVVSTTHQLVQR